MIESCKFKYVILYLNNNVVLSNDYANIVVRVEDIVHDPRGVHYVFNPDHYMA
jgi:hypothetical protein